MLQGFVWNLRRGRPPKLKCPKFKGKVGSRPLLAKLAPDPFEVRFAFYDEERQIIVNDEYIGRLQSERLRGNREKAKKND